MGWSDEVYASRKQLVNHIKRSKQQQRFHIPMQDPHRAPNAPSWFPIITVASIGAATVFIRKNKRRVGRKSGENPLSNLLNTIFNTILPRGRENNNNTRTDATYLSTNPRTMAAAAAVARSQTSQIASNQAQSTGKKKYKKKNKGKQR